MKKTMFASLLAGALLAGSAMAGSWELGADYGGARSQRADVAVSDRTDDASRISVGYRYNPAVSVEVAYADLGRVATAAGDVRNQALTLMGGYHVPVMDQVEIYGKAGAALTRESAAGEHVNQTGLAVAVGAAYALTPELSLRGEVQRLYAFGHSNAEVDVASVGLGYKF